MKLRSAYVIAVKLLSVLLQHTTAMQKDLAPDGSDFLHQLLQPGESSYERDLIHQHFVVQKRKASNLHI